MSVKRTGIGIWLLAAVVLISGCGKQTDNGKGINNGKTVDKVIESHVKADAFFFQRLIQHSQSVCRRDVHAADAARIQNDCSRLIGHVIFNILF